MYMCSIRNGDGKTPLLKNQLQEAFYGEMSIQIGYCNGPNSTLKWS